MSSHPDRQTSDDDLRRLPRESYRGRAYVWRRRACSAAGVCAFCVASCRQSADPIPRPSPAGEGASALSHDADLARPAADSTPRRLRPDDWFEEVTDSSGVDFTYRTGREAGQFTILETAGGGLGLLDYDLDGRADLVCTGGGRIDPQTARPSGLPAGLFRNRGGFAFSAVSAAALPPVPDYSHGCTAGDINNDGFADLFITCYGRSRLWINQGDGTYLDATDALGQRDDTWSLAAAFADVNHDGCLDLFVANYVDWRPSAEEWCGDRAQNVRDVCPPQNYDPLPHHLYLNSRDGVFREVSAEYGIRTDGMGMGVVAADLNADARVDLYVANDVVANHLYLGTETGGLSEVGETAGTAYNEVGTPEGSMGVDAADVDGDGLPELLVANFELEDQSVYRNLGGGAFQHATLALGLGGRSRGMVGFGTGLHDFDGDGWLDLYVLNGHVVYHTGRQPFLQPSYLYRNREGRFEDVTPAAGPWFSVPHAARGAAVGDLDQNGALDLIVSRLDTPVALLRNCRGPANWIRLKLSGTSSPRQPVGAAVTVRAFGRDRVQSVKSGAGYASQSDSRLLFALETPRDQVDVDVVWPGGRRERFVALPTRADCVMIEGHGETQHQTSDTRAGGAR